MLTRIVKDIIKEPVWMKVLSFSLILFFIFLGDAILSFWVPNLLKDSLGSSVKMGLVISFSSAVGLIVDIIFPQLIQGITVKRLVTFGAATSLLFSITLLSSLKLPFIFIFLLAMAIWGVYYEFFGFAEQQFIADTLPLKLRSSGWAFFGVFKNLAYFLGPLIATWIIIKADWAPPVTAIFFVLIGLGILMLLKKSHERPLDLDTTKINLFQEIKHWAILYKHVWPIVVLSLVLGLIDATFWTIGSVFTQALTRQSFWGGFFLPLYQLPSLFLGLIMARLHIFEGKKKLAMKLVLASGVFLFVLGFTNSIFLILACVLISSILLSISYPVANAVYSDIVARMGRERKHLIGLCNGSISLAYIVGPALSGVISGWVGDGKTFSVIGGFSVFVAAVLLLTTPRKLRLPEGEINTWN